MDKQTEKEHKERINKVIDFMFKSINDNVSLDALSRIANYSPFHFQKIFKHITGKTPKQYIIKLRLEAALHLIFIHPHKSILEIAIDCGFSSSSVFSRAFRNFYNTSPEKIRSLNPKEKLKVLKKLNISPTSLSQKKNAKELQVSVKKSASLKGIYILAPFHDCIKIQQTFKELIQLAKANDLYTSDSRLFGILSPHHGHTYMAFLSLDKINGLPTKFNSTELRMGKYASVKTHGKSEETMKAVHYIFQRWLPKSGYKIANEVIGFESFSENPSSVAYHKLQREIHIPIEPV
ncbi:MAG: AraC family transcriptional regulator [Bacteroidetes bacterium]|nr:AraC family transcriptional regulator [Bacteroidota bacterium]